MNFLPQLVVGQQIGRTRALSPAANLIDKSFRVPLLAVGDEYIFGQLFEQVLGTLPKRGLVFRWPIAARQP